jgi:uncharacterized protein
MPFLTAEWRHLLMINYEIDPALLKPYLPHGVEIDSWNGHCYVSMVGFLFLNTRVMGLPVPMHMNFEEVNLRFYVRRGEQRGVVFIREIVPRWAIATIARVLYNEQYIALPMRHAVGNGRVEYEWRTGDRWNRLSAQIAGEPAPIAAGSQEEFITEHYWGYTAQRDGGTLEYRVEHPPWRIWRAAEPDLQCDAAELYGAEFAPVFGGKPESAFVAEGSPIAVYRGIKLSLVQP